MPRDILRHSRTLSALTPLNQPFKGEIGTKQQEWEDMVDDVHHKVAVVVHPARHSWRSSVCQENIHASSELENKVMGHTMSVKRKDNTKFSGKKVMLLCWFSMWRQLAFLVLEKFKEMNKCSTVCSSSCRQMTQLYSSKIKEDSLNTIFETWKENETECMHKMPWFSSTLII